jgi:hypothetical protein
VIYPIWIAYATIHFNLIHIGSSKNEYFCNDTNSAGTSMELEELEPSKLIGPQQDVETIEGWADRNGITCGTARAWANRGVIPSLKLGKRRMVNSTLLRSWLLEQDWTA